MAFRKGRLGRQGSHNGSDLTQVSEDGPLSVAIPPSLSRSIRSSPQSPSAKGICVLVMGLTGAGKSTFISQLTQHSVPVGHSLSSCTAEVYGYPFLRANGHTVWLIDTPGFDDTSKANARILREIVSFLCAVCSNHKLSIGGLLYVHRITDIRMSSSSLKSLRIFENLCGQAAFRDVTVVTTMWDMLQTEDAIRAAEAREAVLKDRDTFFGCLRVGGAKYKRHQNTLSSCLDIIEGVATRGREVHLAVQTELKQTARTTLADTAVGRYLEGDLRNTRRKYETKLAHMEAFTKAQEGEEEDLSIEMVRQGTLIQDTQLSMDHLFVTYEELQKEREAKIFDQSAHMRTNRGNQSKPPPSLQGVVKDRARPDQSNHREGYSGHQQSNKPDESPARDRSAKDKPKKDVSSSPWSNFLHALFGESEDTLVFEKRRSHSMPPESKQHSHRDERSNRPKRAPQSRDRRRTRKLSLQDQRQTTEPDSDSSSVQQCDIYDEYPTAHCDDFTSLPENYVQTQHSFSNDFYTSFTTMPPAHSGYGSAVTVDPSPLRRSYMQGLPYMMKPPDPTAMSGSGSWGGYFAGR